ncbi:hypothetical protein OCU04_001788 [Sclerotinia nivalis]|uniref:Fungal N-terminal domain-containing protein n=1 Tax=Sclerotinia nivalis TaxID=352851 RepID=A0A9X0AZV5_9HELO|nr:hypothetical protein OCU04_001788 [Sclerotinia nivalis]
MPDPFTVTAIASVAGTLSNSIAIANFIKDIKNTPTDVKTCFALTHRVSTDLDHLLLLKSQHSKYISQNPFASKRLDGIISDARESILDICRLLEGCRKEVYEGGHIPVKKRINWVLGDGAAFERRRGNLQQQHVAVLAEIGWLRSLQVGREVERMEEMEFENVELLSKGRRERSGVSVSRAGKRFDKIGVEELDIGGDVEVGSPVVKNKIVRKPVAVSSESHEEVIEYEDIEDEDPEVAFFKDLRRQEEERERRIAGRRKLMNL